jgi:hypothetical protein
MSAFLEEAAEFRMAAGNEAVRGFASCPPYGLLVRIEARMKNHADFVASVPTWNRGLVRPRPPMSAPVASGRSGRSCGGLPEGVVAEWCAGRVAAGVEFK